jgi:hypothetical protein
MSFNDLATMISYFEEQEGKIQQLVAEIDEINQGITSELVEAEDQVETAVATAVSVADEQYDSLALWVVEAVEASLPAIQEAKTARRAELEKLISDLYGQRAEIEQQDAQTMDELAQANPQLNAREEELKQQRTEADARIAEIEAQLRRAGAGLGWLTRFGRIRELRKQHQQQATVLYGLRERLGEVRTTWEKTQTEAREEKERLQTAWRLRTAEIGKFTQELDDLTDDFDGTCRRAALEALIRERESYEPSGSAALDEALQSVVDWRHRHADCESGVIAVSEIMGLLNGVHQGMGRMRESIEGVKKEQDMHAELSTLHLSAPPAFLQFHQIWDALYETVVDEKRSIEHPKAFADIVNQVTEAQLSDETINAMFETAGSVLTEGTKQWD